MDKSLLSGGVYCLIVHRSSLDSLISSVISGGNNSEHLLSLLLRGTGHCHCLCTGGCNVAGLHALLYLFKNVQTPDFRINQAKAPPQCVSTDRPR